ncbi:MAG: penicillin-binding protein 2 [Mariprofundaceae bacterium]|nr:penicillin-binding protein 2 [Mariprofundaceae bacterium]
MLNQLDIRQRFDGRMVLFQVTVALLLLLLFARLINLQLYQHEGLLLQANKNRINVVPLLPTRGVITDRNGKGLALNHVSYQVQMISERIENMEKTLATLQQLLAWNDQQLNNIRERIRQARSDRPVLLMDKLPWESVAPLAARLHHLSGVNVVAGTHRYYPYDELTSHLIGYLSLAGPKDLNHGYLRTENVGRSGLERTFEATLHGSPGTQQEEIDARGQRVAVLKQTPPQIGMDVRLSIDVDLQQTASDALGQRTGAVIVMDVHSGELLTVLSKPGFNTNHFITGLEHEQWQAWIEDTRKPLLNRTTQAAYPPASTLKMVAAFAGLKHKLPLATGNTQCPGYLELADRSLRCWNRKGHKHVTLHKALVQSCDVYFYELGDQLGMQRLTDEARMWGFGEQTGVVITPEARGSIPAAEKQLHNGRTRAWYRGETMITAIGQGVTTVTPIQMARFAAAIANGGKILKPKLYAGPEPTVIREVEVEENHLAIVRKAMRDVIAESKGTAHWALNWAPWPIAGKTGTAQVVAMAQDDEEESATPELDKHKDHAWFMGYAPYDDPKVAFAIFVEHGGHGGSDAAPVAKAIVRKLAQQEQERAL